MGTHTETIIDRLSLLGFRVREGGLAPFQEAIPLVSGVAWDSQTAQVALLAEIDLETDIAAVRQLLFASAGLRHHLAADGPTAFGSPVVLAIVDDQSWKTLRDLAEELAANYVLFNRVDLNLIRHSDLKTPEGLDDALAPLLPRCRSMFDQEISRADVQRFWALLRDAVQQTASRLEPPFSSYAKSVGTDFADQLVADDADAPELPAPHPIGQLSIRNFRSIREANIEFAPVSIVHGPNGGGKSSLLEAMEFAWAGASQRMPASVSAEEYGRHLPRNGLGEFSISHGGTVTTEVSDKPQAELARNVLTHESVAALVSQSPEERYSALLTTTGLEMPDLAARADTLLTHAKRVADDALAEVGLPRLPRRNSLGLKHLQASLTGSLVQQLPSIHDVVGAEEALARRSEGAYIARSWPSDEHATAALIRVETLISHVIERPSQAPGEISEAIDDARTQVQRLLAPRRAAIEELRPLLQVIRSSISSPEPPRARPDLPPSPLDRGLAVRWLGHANALRDAAARFRQDAQGIESEKWNTRLQDYADAIEQAALSAPTSELEKLGRDVAPRSDVRPPVPEEERFFSAAGFTAVPNRSDALVDALEALVTTLDQQISSLQVLGAALTNHPAERFHKHRDMVLNALCRYELARKMKGVGPILKASETLVGELLQKRLAPVVRELVASIVRFEWYFRPLLVPDKNAKVVLGGLATSQPDLDARLLLNSAERTALGIAWFLALHLLQPKERQEVLVLDDPISAFDAPNQAGLVSTLRAFVRLTRPKQLVLATHDEAMAAVLAQELAPVDGWPAALTTLRCQRDNSDCSRVIAEAGYDRSRHLNEEAECLGLGGEPIASRTT